MKPYKLFIDDERIPVTNDWVIARTSERAAFIVAIRGIPVEMALDHDLGGSDTIFVFLTWLEQRLHKKQLKLPKGFRWSVHSQNPVGAKSAKLFMTDLVKNYGDEE